MKDMKKPLILTANEAVQLVKDDDTVSFATISQIADSIFKALEERYLTEEHPKNLTLFHSCGQTDGKRGMSRLCHKGMVKRIIGAHWGLQPGWMKAIANNEVEAYSLPQGQMAHLYRSMACGAPGKISKVGLDTFVDPRVLGGKMNDKTLQCEDLVELINIGNEEYLRYKPIPVDILIIRGLLADELGNLSTEDEGMKLEILPAVLATKKNGGKVLAQVKHIVKNSSIHPQKVTIPGVFIDALVLCENPQEEQRQTVEFSFNPAYTGDIRVTVGNMKKLPLNARKVIGRRAICELRKDVIINLGIGIPNDVFGSIAAEEDIMDEVMLTVETGIYGGIPSGGYDFGASTNPVAMITHDAQFDFYDGAGVDFAFMGAGEIDAEGNVNATKFGNKAPGAGGFIDITQNAKHVVFCSTFTGKGLNCSFKNCELEIEKEGLIKKLVKNVQQVSYSGKRARENNQRMTFVTERAVFELKREGLMLTEIAPGINLEKDILGKMDFEPLISEDLKVMDTRLFSEGVSGLKKAIEKNSVGVTHE